MKNLIFTFLLCSIGYSLFAQDYKSSVGLRLGYPSGITYKMFLNETAAVEGILGYRSFGLGNWMSIDAAYQLHQDLEFESLEGLQWYYGGGLGFNRYSFDNFLGEESFSATFISIKGYTGLSYTLEDTPVNFTFDAVPAFYIGDGLGGISNLGVGFALAVRYVIN